MAEKNFYITYLRVIATVFVVLIHASAGFLYNFDSESFDWNYANWINAATRCSVPIFVMLSGALLLSKEEETMSFYNKRISKLLLPLFFWTVIYVMYILTFSGGWSALTIAQILTFGFQKLISGANAHLWYLYMAIGLYFAIPFLQKLISRCTVRELEIFIVLWFASIFFMNKQYNLPKFDLTFFSGYVGYLVLGYYLRIKDISWGKWTNVFLYTISFAGIAIGTLYFSSEKKTWDTQLIGYTTPLVALTAAFLFLSVKSFVKNTHKAPKWVTLIEKYSFGIYLVHIIPLNFVHPLVSIYVSTLWVIPLATVFTIVLSIVILFFLHKIPYGKHLTG